jgi:hypothetical protein
MLPLRRTPQYVARVRHYYFGLAERYGADVADKFLDRVSAQQDMIERHNEVGTQAPYILTGQEVVLREVYFDSPPSKYCLIYEILDDCVSLISLWHATGARNDGVLIRLWK